MSAFEAVRCLTLHLTVLLLLHELLLDAKMMMHPLGLGYCVVETQHLLRQEFGMA